MGRFRWIKLLGLLLAMLTAHVTAGSGRAAACEATTPAVGLGVVAASVSPGEPNSCNCGDLDCVAEADEAAADAYASYYSRCLDRGRSPADCEIEAQKAADEAWLETYRRCMARKRGWWPFGSRRSAAIAQQADLDLSRLQGRPLTPHGGQAARL